MTAQTDESNLVAHARRELELLGEDPLMTEAILACIRTFADQGHSGFSAAYAIERIGQLLRWENLTPLTKDPDEWMQVSAEMWPPDGVWQSRRRPDAFSNDGGATYYLLDEEPRVMHEAVTP